MPQFNFIQSRVYAGSENIFNLKNKLRDVESIQKGYIVIEQNVFIINQIKCEKLLIGREKVAMNAKNYISNMNYKVQLLN